MPLYDYSCPSCGKSGEGFEKIENRNQHKCECGEVMNILISKVTDASYPAPGEYNWGCGEVVNSWKHLKEICKRKDLVSHAII